MNDKRNDVAEKHLITNCDANVRKFIQLNGSAQKVKVG